MTRGSVPSGIIAGMSGGLRSVLPAEDDGGAAGTGPPVELQHAVSEVQFEVEPTQASL